MANFVCQIFSEILFGRAISSLTWCARFCGNTTSVHCCCCVAIVTILPLPPSFFAVQNQVKGTSNYPVFHLFDLEPMANFAQLSFGRHQPDKSSAQGLV